MDTFAALEICAGTGGQALGLEQAGFDHAAAVEIDLFACASLRMNRPQWQVLEQDVHTFEARNYKGIELLAGGVPCPPFSRAGKQLGADDERDLFPEALRLVDECRPRAVMIENVRGLLDEVFADYRRGINQHLVRLGYRPAWKLLHASDYGVSQLRPRVVMVALRNDLDEEFIWPAASLDKPQTVGALLSDLMSSRGWEGADDWRQKANTIAPTIVGGSKKHGGPDLGPTRAKHAWAQLGVNGHGIADEPPEPGFAGMPKLTVRMVARVQGFPDTWQFAGKKTAQYRQVGNAFPPPVAFAVAAQIRETLLQKVPFYIAVRGQKSRQLQLLESKAKAV